jgi:hypothetical protein
VAVVARPAVVPVPASRPARRLSTHTSGAAGAGGGEHEHEGGGDD